MNKVWQGFDDKYRSRRFSPLADMDIQIHAGRLSKARSLSDKTHFNFDKDNGIMMADVTSIIVKGI
jgi:hypothetical protein